jgi:hypothetical protein
MAHRALMAHSIPAHRAESYFRGYTLRAGQQPGGGCPHNAI